MMAKKEPVNLIPRPVAALPALGANLWALACGLEALSRRKNSAEVFAMRNFAVNYQEAGHHCKTVRCALGYAPVLGIGMPTTRAAQARLNSNFGHYSYSKQVLLGEGGMYYQEWAWCFSAEWEWKGRDNTLLGAAQRIGFLVCHYDAISRDRAYADYLESEVTLVPRLHKVRYAKGSLFDRWRRRIDWNVTPEIPGAKKVVDRAIKRANTIKIHG